MRKSCLVVADSRGLVLDVMDAMEELGISIVGVVREQPMMNGAAPLNIFGMAESQEKIDSLSCRFPTIVRY
jgi:ACT domain-containing protein